MFPSQNLNLFVNPFTKSLLKYFLWFLLHLKHFDVDNFSNYFYSRQDLQYLYLLLSSSSERLSARLDSELVINLTLSINFIPYIIFYHFQALSLLILKNLRTFCIQTFFQILQLTLLQLNGNHISIHCVKLMEFHSYFYILDCM